MLFVVAAGSQDTGSISSAELRLMQVNLLQEKKLRVFETVECRKLCPAGGKNETIYRNNTETIHGKI